MRLRLSIHLLQCNCNCTLVWSVRLLHNFVDTDTLLYLSLWSRLVYKARRELVHNTTNLLSKQIKYCPRTQGRENLTSHPKFKKKPKKPFLHCIDLFPFGKHFT